eukprot:TCONS_00016248-protein
MSRNKNSSVFTETKKALEQNDVVKLKNILKNIENKDLFVEEFKLSPLSFAIKQNCSESVIKELVNIEGMINEGVNYETLNEIDINPIILACKNKNYDIMELLIEKGAFLDVKDFCGVPLLHLACRNGLKFVKLLIYNGANPRLMCLSENTVLHEAIHSHASFELVHFLLKCGINTSAKNTFGDTAVCIAVADDKLEPAVRVMLQTTMAQQQKSTSIKETVKRKLCNAQTQPLDKLKNDIQQIEKKMRTNDTALRKAYERVATLEEKQSDFLKSVTSKRKELNKFIDSTSTVFGTQLECPYCMDEFSTGVIIYQCSNGHLLCTKCQQRFKKCQQCTVALDVPIRNTALEGIVKSMSTVKRES